MRKLLVTIGGLAAALGVSAASADCGIIDSRTCSGRLSQIVADPVSADVFIRVVSQDESSLGCAPSGPDVVANRALKLARASPVFNENYQIAVLASASYLSVRATMRDPALTGGICEIDTLVLEPFN